MNGLYDVIETRSDDQKPEIPEGKFCVWYDKKEDKVLLLANINGKEYGVELG